MSGRRTLYGLSPSPFSHKARWALLHHELAHDYVEHVPMLGEPLLRLRARRLRGRVSVPLLVDDGRVFADSFEIARHADRIGRNEKLFPTGREDDVAAWNARSDRAVAAGRILFFRRFLSNPAALAESLPSFIPRPVRGIAVPAARLAVAFLTRKYANVAAVDPERVLRDELDVLRAALGRGDSILGAPSYADIAMACVLQVIEPVGDAFIPLGPATRQAWTDAELAETSRDLLAWRDRVFAARWPRR